MGRIERPPGRAPVDLMDNMRVYRDHTPSDVLDIPVQLPALTRVWDTLFQVSFLALVLLVVYNGAYWALYEHNAAMRIFGGILFFAGLPGFIITLRRIYAILRLPGSYSLLISADGGVLRVSSTAPRSDVIEYDLSSVRGAWIERRFLNDAPMGSCIVLSKTPGRKNGGDPSPVIDLDLLLSSDDTIYESNLLILEYIRERYPHISVGLDTL